MKNHLLFIFASTVFIASVGFAFQKPEEVRQEKAIQDPKESSKADELARELEAIKRELAAERKKSDSIDNQRMVNLGMLKSNVGDLQRANTSYRKSLNRLVYIIGKFNPDSVMKYYSEFPEQVEPASDTVKKKIESEEIAIPSPKKSIWKRIFGGKH